MRETKPIWTSSTLLVYTGGLTVLGGGIGALFYLSTQYPGAGEGTGWALLVLAILYVIAHALRRRDRPMAAGIFAFASVIAWAVFVAVLFKWWGWSGIGGSFSHWSWSRLALWLLILLSAWDNRRRFRFPFIRAISAVVFFRFVIQLLPAGGNWTAAWALIVGLLYLLVGNVADKPSAFWLHVVGGALIGGAILYWCHTSDFDFAVVSFMALVFVVWSHWTKRSSWTVYGTIGFFIATNHYVFGSPLGGVSPLAGLAGGLGAPRGIATGLLSSGLASMSGWSPPLAFGLLGFWLVFLGILGRRRRRVAVVVEETVVVETPAE